MQCTKSTIEFLINFNDFMEYSFVSEELISEFIYPIFQDFRKRGNTYIPDCPNFRNIKETTRWIQTYGTYKKETKGLSDKMIMYRMRDFFNEEGFQKVRDVSWENIFFRKMYQLGYYKPQFTFWNHLHDENAGREFVIPNFFHHDDYVYCLSI